MYLRMWPKMPPKMSPKLRRPRPPPVTWEMPFLQYEDEGLAEIHRLSYRMNVLLEVRDVRVPAIVWWKAVLVPILGRHLHSYSPPDA